MADDPFPVCIIKRYQVMWYQKVAAVLQKRIPIELADRVCESVAAMVIQIQFRVWSRFCHCRRPEWLKLRQSLGASVVFSLWRYCNLRREWRHEPRSWLEREIGVDQVIVKEAKHGLWGSCLPF